MIALLLTLFAFLFGALPFSVWLGRLAGRDLRQVGDGNPGATNALRAGGWRVGVAAYFLDTFKGALPVGLAYQLLDLRGPGMWAVALAPSLGHAFSPFLKGRGGKALASILGVWIGFTLGELALVILLFLTMWHLLLENAGWAVLLTGLCSLAYLLLHHPTPLFLGVMAAQIVLVIWKHRADLSRRPRFRFFSKGATHAR